MKDVISELLQRKEQQEEDLYFDTLNREVVAQLHGGVVTGKRRGTGPLQRARRTSGRQSHTGR
jgi:hypothetical protein